MVEVRRRRAHAHQLDVHVQPVAHANHVPKQAAVLTAPETVRLDHEAFLRMRARGDTRPATAPQIRRVFGLARSAGLVLPSGGVDCSGVVALVERVAGTGDVGSLTREQVQGVYDVLEQLVVARSVGQAA